jgi:hypothetical protein
VRFNRHFFVPVNGIQWLTLVLAVALAAGFTFGTMRLDNVQAHENDAIRSIMCFAELRTRQSQVLTPQQKRQGIQFYDQALAKAQIAPCAD